MGADLKKLLLRIFGWINFVIIPALPPILVQSASTTLRLVWLLFWGILVGISLYVIWQMKSPNSKTPFRSVKPQYQTDASNLAERAPGLAMILSFSCAMLLSIFFVNLQSSDGTFAGVAKLLSDFVHPIFPWVGNFRSKLTTMPPAPEIQFFKVQAVVCLWFLSGLLISILMVISRFSMSDARRSDVNAAKTWTHEQYPFVRKREFGLIGNIFSGIIALGFGIVAYFGWWDFDMPTSARTISKCGLFVVPCYIFDDLQMIAAAILKMLIIFGFGFGGLITAMRGFGALSR